MPESASRSAATIAGQRIRKLKTREQIRKIAHALKKQGKTVVFTNGCFDILHAGHVDYLERARSKGDVLIVGLNSDWSVRVLKGTNRPINPAHARARVLSALEMVDYIVYFGEMTPESLLKEIRPHILVKGSDYKEEEIAGRQYARQVLRMPLVKGYSTTEIVKRILPGRR